MYCNQRNVESHRSGHDAIVVAVKVLKEMQKRDKSFQNQKISENSVGFGT